MLAGIKEFFETESDEVLYDKLTKVIKENNTIEAKTIEAKKLIEKIKNTELFNKANNYKNTLLHSAIEQGLKEVSEILISKMSNEAINIIEEYILHGEQKGETYLTLLASKGFGKACESLIPRMYSETINTITKTNNTALTLAADKKLVEVCKALIPRMSDETINIIDNNYKGSALKKSIRNDMDEVAQMLIPKTSNDNINVIDRTGNTLLITAAKKGMNAVCILLISRMSNELINHVNNAGDTAASLASDDPKFEVAYKLLQEIQTKFVKITTQDVESSLQKISFELDNSCNANKNFIQDVLFKKIQKLGDNKANLQKIDKKIQIIIEDINHISDKLTDLDNYVNHSVDSQKPQEVDISEILGGVDNLPLE